MTNKDEYRKYTVEKCEARYGGKRCENFATKAVAAKGQLFNFCKECAKLTKKQNKLNQ